MFICFEIDTYFKLNYEQLKLTSYPCLSRTYFNNPGLFIFYHPIPIYYIIQVAVYSLASNIYTPNLKLSLPFLLQRGTTDYISLSGCGRGRYCRRGYRHSTGSDGKPSYTSDGQTSQLSKQTLKNKEKIEFLSFFILKTYQPSNETNFLCQQCYIY